MFAILEVALLFRVDQIIVAGRGHDRDLHARLDTGFQVDVLVQIHVRPEIDQLDLGVAAADTVDTAKALNDAYWIPMNVVIDQIVAVLQVLTFGNAVSGDQNVNVFRATRHEDISVF